MSKYLSKVFSKVILLSCCLTAGGAALGQSDTTKRMPVRTIGLVALGTAGTGLGLSYEQSFSRYIPVVHVKRYMYWHGCIGYAGYNGMTATIGSGLHQRITRNRNFFVGAGANAGVLINFDATPKELREYWDSIEFYGGNYVNPVEFGVVPELDLSYLGQYWFFRLQFTPVFLTSRIGKTQVVAVPWGGLSVGARLDYKKRSPAQDIPQEE